MTAPQPFPPRPNPATLKVGVFAHLAEHNPHVEDTYNEFLDLFEHADRNGVDSAWVRQFHFAKPDAGRFGGLASPFVFLSVLAARTKHIRLGTAAVTLPLEQALRVAEDAATLDLLSGGRLELGFANGGSPESGAAFGTTISADGAERRASYLNAVARIQSALRGEAVLETGESIAPTSPTLADRIWHANLTDTGAFDTGRRGEGVLIGTTQVVPGEVSAEAYHRGLPEGVAPRLGLSTWIFPGASREDALRRAELGLREKWEWGGSFLGPADSLEEIASRLNLHYGTPDDIIESISKHPAFPYTTQIQLQLDGLYRGLSERTDALDLFLQNVAPALGWVRNTSLV